MRLPYEAIAIQRVDGAYEFGIIGSGCHNNRDMPQLRAGLDCLQDFQAGNLRKR